MAEKGREEKVKTLRIIQIDEMIREGNYPNVPAMMKKFETSRATIMRDIEFLKDRYNAPLEYDYTRKGYYYTDKSFFIKSVMLTEGELFSVSAITPLLEQYKNTPLEASIRNIFSKVTGLLPEKVSVDTSLIGKDLSFISDPLPAIDQNVFYKIFESLKSKKTIVFAYRSISQTSFSSKTANPLHVICRKGDWYMIAWDHKRKEIRTYSLARIKNIEITEDYFEIPIDFNPENYFDSSFGIWNTNEEPKQIELLFSKKLNTYILERKWHETQKIKQNDDGSVLLTFHSNQMQETCNWVMSFGSNVQVLNPPELITMIKTEISKMTEIYK